jgi:hypothetical protein
MGPLPPSALHVVAGGKILESQVKDPELRAKLKPDYVFGCKRVGHVGK